MKQFISQGDILKVEKLTLKILVVSKDVFNQSGEIIGIPIFETGETGALHIAIQTKKTKGIVHCENLGLLDLAARGYSVIDRVAMSDIINITDAIQGIFDYV